MDLLALIAPHLKTTELKRLHQTDSTDLPKSDAAVVSSKTSPREALEKSLLIWQNLTEKASAGQQIVRSVTKWSLI